MVKNYLESIKKLYEKGDTREESFYSIIADFLTELAKDIKSIDVDVRILPKKTEAGNPDIKIWKGTNEIIGYVEVKKLNEELDKIEESEQLERYRKAFPNLILTNLLEFRIYRSGNLVDKIEIVPFKSFALLNLTSVTKSKEQEIKDFFGKFFSFAFPQTFSTEEMAKALADKTKILKWIVSSLFEEGEKFLSDLYGSLGKYLITDITKEDFCDLYAQTLAYGLFAARLRSKNEFNRREAFYVIPKTFGILRDIFKIISLEDIPEQMEWIIDDIASLLAHFGVSDTFKKYRAEKKGEDPVIYFYENFLAEYAPEERERRGVYYTPGPVVSYIVRSLNAILKNKFGISDGLSDKKVTVLDPAGGTLSFLEEAIKVAVDEFKEKYGDGSLKEFIKDHIINDFYAFELMMAPYVIGHMRISFLLEDYGYQLSENERIKFYLTNTLETKVISESSFPFFLSISEESKNAEKVKEEIPIIVIMGNPPYSVRSMNKTEFIEKEMDVYKQDVRGETNIQPLSDDYIKFIRFAHWKINQNKVGTLGMITNNSYLSGLIHRGMRKKLLESFDEIYILNLHGSTRLGEKTPTGGKDENVFDIMQGVCVAFFIKTGQQDGLGKVYYQDIFGIREEKYNFLESHDFKTTNWKELKPAEPYYFFVEKDFSMQKDYEKFVPITKIFNKFSSGIKTRRDNFIVDFNKEKLEQKINIFTSNLPEQMLKESLSLKDTADWKVSIAREKVKKVDWKNYIRQYAYRPFDIRYLFYFPDIIERGDSRINLMQNFFEENLGLVTTRKNPEIFGIPCFISDKVGDIHLIGDQTYFFPLYLYPSADKKGLFKEGAKPTEKFPNIKPEIFDMLAKKFGNCPSPEEIFYYIYSVLYSNSYRTKYAEFLKIDFPRIPLTSNYEIFVKMSALGKRLVGLHLLKSQELNPPIAKFQGAGNSEVVKVKFVESENRVYINRTQYFEGITKEVFEYQIGGYQVMSNWLKYRKGCFLTLEETMTYCKIATAVAKTIEVQKEIDDLYLQCES